MNQRFDQSENARGRMHMSCNKTNSEKKGKNCNQCLNNKHCMERDREYPCTSFQRKEKNTCDWVMQENENLT